MIDRHRLLERVGRTASNEPIERDGIDLDCLWVEIQPVIVADDDLGGLVRHGFAQKSEGVS